MSCKEGAPLQKLLTLPAVDSVDSVDSAYFVIVCCPSYLLSDTGPRTPCSFFVCHGRVFDVSTVFLEKVV